MIAGGLGGDSGGAAQAADIAASRTIALRKQELDLAGIAFAKDSVGQNEKTAPRPRRCRGRETNGGYLE
jgi:hypothetical protein